MKQKNFPHKYPSGKIIYIKNITLLFFLIIFFLCGCSKKTPKNLSSPKKATYRFFQHLLLECGGAYTLFGDKPITIEDMFYYDDEDLKTLDKLLQEELKRNPDYQYYSVERTFEEDWKIVKDYILSPQTSNFIAVEFPNAEEPKFSLFVLVNIEKTALTLQKYYSEFFRELQMDFDPLQIVFEIKNPSSSFWQGVWKNPFLLGLLLGYGYENARLCSWVISHDKSSNSSLQSFTKFLRKKQYASDINDPLIKYPVKLDGKPFRLPIFACHDEALSKVLIKKYKKQRTKIINLYKNQDFLQVTWNRLQNTNLPF